MRVLLLASEAAPFCRTGGLGDVATALADALCNVDRTLDVALLVPLYRQTRAALAQAGVELSDTGISPDLTAFGTGARVYAWRPAGGARQLFLDSRDLYDRDGLYGHVDDARRFAALSWAALDAAEALLGGVPDVVHANDWHTALAPVYLETRLRARWPRTRSVFSIHNLAYQGIFPKAELPRLGLSWSLFTPEALEFWDRLSFLKGGIVFADALTTVSPSYAKEILGAEQGHGLDGLLRAHASKLLGILNGIDTRVWSPERDPHLPAHYAFDDLDGKARCREALLAELGLTGGGAEPLLGVVARLAHQKGLDLVADLAPELPRLGARLAVLGSGDAPLAERLTRLAAALPGHLAVRIGFDDALSHRIIAGADAFLMPSRYEPCGLSQMYAMAYGTLPIVHATGGLIDTVADAGRGSRLRPGATGWHFAPATAEALLAAVEHAVACFRDRRSAWRRMIRAAMTLDFGWERSARAYLELYHRLIGARAEPQPSLA